MWYPQLEDCTMEVLMDASNTGWGIYFCGQLHRGLWASVADAPVHINAKELIGLLYFLWDFLPQSVDPIDLLGERTAPLPWRTSGKVA